MFAFSLRRTFAFAGVIVALGFSSPSQAELEKVSLTLNWIPYGLHVGPAVAKTQGLYKAVGLDVKILRGYGSSESVKRVALGTTTFALADATPVVFGRGKGLAVRMIAIILDKSGNAIYYRKSSGIKSPKDLEGKQIASTPAASYLKLFPVYAKAVGMDAAKIKWVTMNGSAIIPSFAASKVDAMITFTTEQPNVERAARRAKIKWGRFLFADAGVDLYSVGIIASDAMVVTRPKLVKKFLNATMEGYRRAVKNPKAAVAAFIKQFPENNPKLVLAQWKASMELFLTDVAKKKGLGYMTEAKMAKTLEMVRGYARIDKKVTASDLYTMKFLKPIMLDK